MKPKKSFPKFVLINKYPWKIIFHFSIVFFLGVTLSLFLGFLLHIDYRAGIIPSILSGIVLSVKAMLEDHFLKKD
jgi:hypothetical protein